MSPKMHHFPIHLALDPKSACLQKFWRCLRHNCTCASLRKQSRDHFRRDHRISSHRGCVILKVFLFDLKEKVIFLWPSSISRRLHHKFPVKNQKLNPAKQFSSSPRSRSDDTSANIVCISGRSRSFSYIT